MLKGGNCLGEKDCSYYGNIMVPNRNPTFYEKSFNYLALGKYARVKLSKLV